MSAFKEPPPRPFLKWVGGKRQLLPVLLNAVELAGAFQRYHEPFFGGGALFFALARTERLRRRAYLSDVNANLIDAYLGVRDDADAVIQRLKEHKRRHGERYFYDVRATGPRVLSRRAARLIYLNRTCYNGLYRENSKGRFNAPFGRYKNPSICDEENLRAVSTTLAGVDIAARDFTAATALARRGDLIYFDPPYAPVSKTADFTSYSRGGFGIDEHRRLAETFAALAARGVKLILSNSMTALTRELYDDFYIYDVLANRRVNSRADRRGKITEALITSFPLEPERDTVNTPLNGRHFLPNGASGGIERMLARQWLLENGYKDIAKLIDKVTDEWKTQGKATRRNWWEILAGDAKGNPRIAAGREFPVLRAAQQRQGMPVTKNALCRNRKEEAPPVRVTNRWSKKKAKRTAARR